MMQNMKKEEILKLLDYNIEKISGHLQKIAAKISAEGAKKKKRVQKSESSLTDSDKSDRKPHIRFLPKNFSSSSESSFSSSESSDAENSSKDMVRMKIDPPEVENFEKNDSFEKQEKQRTHTDPLSRKPVDNLNMRRKSKSKFVTRGKPLSKTKEFSTENSLMSSKRDINFNIGGPSQNFLKGGNTVPLISTLMSEKIRNNNLFEVYERLKFLSKECFKTKDRDMIVFLNIQREVDLYLQSYQDEDNEDSDWDSDEEVGAVSISKKLQDAIKEK